jgi:hypothetical protein
VQRQLDAYNARNIEALMATYSDDAQQFEYPTTLLASGAEQVRERTAGRFRESNLHARLIKRIVMGQVVIDHEEVTRTFPEGTGKIELVTYTRCATAGLPRPDSSPAPARRRLTLKHDDQPSHHDHVWEHCPQSFPLILDSHSQTKSSKSQPDKRGRF